MEPSKRELLRIIKTLSDSPFSADGCDECNQEGIGNCRYCSVRDYKPHRADCIILVAYSVLGRTV